MYNPTFSFISFVTFLVSNKVNYFQIFGLLLHYLFDTCIQILTHKAPNTTIAEFANTADPDETAHNEPSHLDLQCLPSSL